MISDSIIISAGSIVTEGVSSNLVAVRNSFRVIGELEENGNK